MKIIVLEGSPNKNGSSNLLAASIVGMVLGTGCGTADMTRRSEFPKLAYELGRSLSKRL